MAGWPAWLADRGFVGQEFHDELTGADWTIAFFILDGGLMPGLYEHANLAKGCQPARPARPSSA